MSVGRRPQRTDPVDREAFGDDIDRKAQRKIRRRAERRKSPWFWAGMFGLVGWSVTIPTVVGLYIGIRLDEWYPGEVSWTLTGLFAGVVLGCINAWFWVKRESTREDRA